jgi:tetratricopeptide (TPR) repeat protein
MDNLEILEQQSVDAAINLQWKEAVRLNLEIVKSDKENIAAYLRLGFANLQLNNLKESKKYYRRALRIQGKNSVALDNLEKIKILEAKGAKNHKFGTASFKPDLFIEIPGKTKTVFLVNHGQKDVLAKLFVGEEVELKIKKRRVEVRTVNNEYMGSLPDDLSKRLIFFIKAGSVYKTIIKEADLNHVAVFINEEKKGKKAGNNISFPLIITQKTELQSSPDEKTEEEADEDEGSEELNSLEALANEINAEEKETIAGIQTDESEEEEEE